MLLFPMNALGGATVDRFLNRILLGRANGALDDLRLIGAFLELEDLRADFHTRSARHTLVRIDHDLFRHGILLPTMDGYAKPAIFQLPGLLESYPSDSCRLDSPAHSRRKYER